VYTRTAWREARARTQAAVWSRSLVCSSDTPDRDGPFCDTPSATLVPAPILIKPLELHASYQITRKLEAGWGLSFTYPGSSRHQPEAYPSAPHRRCDNDGLVLSSSTTP
jgi:hypothetical protein